MRVARARQIKLSICGFVDTHLAPMVLKALQHERVRVNAMGMYAMQDHNAYPLHAC